MVKNITLLVSGLLFILVSCRKSTEEQPPVKPPVKGILINGDDYPTDTIGNQIWTTLNYSGPGGFEHDQKPAYVNYGKYYTPQEAVQIKLPDGWRVPTRTDYNKLLTELGGKTGSDGNSYAGISTYEKLATADAWRKPSTNSSGFGAYPAGYAVYDAASDIMLRYAGAEHQAMYLTSNFDYTNVQGKPSKKVYILSINPDDSSPSTCEVYYYTTIAPTIPLFSLRFVKDKK